jgi:hypothetical protein
MLHIRHFTLGIAAVPPCYAPGTRLQARVRRTRPVRTHSVLDDDFTLAGVGRDSHAPCVALGSEGLPFDKPLSLPNSNPISYCPLLNNA